MASKTQTLKDKAGDAVSAIASVIPGGSSSDTYSEKELGEKWLVKMASDGSTSLLYLANGGALKEVNMFRQSQQYAGSWKVNSDGQLIVMIGGYTLTVTKAKGWPIANGTATDPQGKPYAAKYGVMFVR